MATLAGMDLGYGSQIKVVRTNYLLTVTQCLSKHRRWYDCTNSAIGKCTGTMYNT